MSVTSYESLSTKQYLREVLHREQIHLDIERVLGAIDRGRDPVVEPGRPDERLDGRRPRRARRAARAIDAVGRRIGRRIVDRVAALLACGHQHREQQQCATHRAHYARPISALKAKTAGYFFLCCSLGQLPPASPAYFGHTPYSSRR